MLLTAAGTDPSCVVLTRWPSGAVADPWRRELASLAPRAALVGSATSDDGSCEVVVLGPSLAAALTARPDAERAWTAHVLHDRTEVIHMGQRLVRTIGRTGAVLSHQLLPPYPRAPGT
jgi:hypothetical protein